MIASRLLFLLLLTAIVAPAPAGAASDAGRPATRLAQLTLPTAAPLPAVSGLVVSGMYVTAPIVLDGTVLFRIGASVNPPVTEIPIGARVTDIETALEQLLAQDGSGPRATTVFNPATLRVHIRRAGNADVLEAIDGKHADPLSIVTVTDNDAQANGTDVNALAAQWQSILQSALVQALQLRQPSNEARSFWRAAQVVLIMVLVSIAVVGVLRVIWKRMEPLEREIAEGDEALAAQAEPAEEPASPERQRRRFALELRNLQPKQRLTIYAASVEALTWGLLLAWFITVTWGLSLFAETTPLAQVITHSAIGVAITIVATGLINRILDIVIARAADAWRLRRINTSEDRARLLLRVPTISQAIAGGKAFILVFIAVLSIFGQIGVPIGSVVTIGGLAAVALSLAAQNFVRDFLNGFLVLYEDQYVVGDYVTINAFSGSVELLSLRMVQLRDAAGDLITIPHSSVTNVVNQSRNWSRVDYRVPVDPAADPDTAIAILREQVEKLITEGDWTRGVSAPIEWVGIDSMSKDAVVIRISIKTAPLRQFELRRKINARVHAAFVHAGIGLGAPLTA